MAGNESRVVSEAVKEREGAGLQVLVSRNVYVKLESTKKGVG